MVISDWVLRGVGPNSTLTQQYKALYMGVSHNFKILPGVTHSEYDFCERGNASPES